MLSSFLHSTCGFQFRLCKKKQKKQGTLHLKFFTDEVFYVFPSGCTKDIKLKNPFKVYAANTSQTRKQF